MREGESMMGSRTWSESHALVREGRVILKGSKTAMLRALKALPMEQTFGTQLYRTSRKVGEVLGTGAGV